jgi:hypothetical protein
MSESAKLQAKLGVTLIARLVMALAFTATLVACTDDENTVRTLKASGFTDIQTTGYAAFACSDSDTFHTGFRAKNPRGDVVEGVVCCGMMKACTVRF